MTLASPSARIGFIGLGIMGKSMVRNIMAGGWAVSVYSRSPEKCRDVIAAGAQWLPSAADAAKSCDIVVTMVGYPADVEEVYFGPKGILENARPGAVVIDMTTSSPGLARRIAETASTFGLLALDAPVSGGDVGAREGTLAIMCGGSPEAFEKALPVLECMGKSIALMGPPGSGQHAKAVNQIVIAGTIIGVAEAMNYAERAKLDLNKVLETIGKGAAGGFQLNVLGKRMAQGDFQPGFFVRHFLKDMGIALAEAEVLGLDLAGLKTSQRQFAAYAEAGGREKGTQGIFEHYAAKSADKVPSH